MSYSSDAEAIAFKPISLKAFVDSPGVKKIITQNNKVTIYAPFQGKKAFCAYGSESKYIVTIKGNNVLIVTGKIKITGTFKKDKLFTHDPEEIEYRKFAGKYNYGKYYVIGADYFSILNSENGEYRYYTLCK
ncbi:MAG: hypothetical protein ABIO76_06440 [Ginsengibacter sp.]